MNAKEKFSLFVIKQNDIRFLVNYFINTSNIKSFKYPYILLLFPAQSCLLNRIKHDFSTYEISL